MLTWSSCPSTESEIDGLLEGLFSMTLIMRAIFPIKMALIGMFTKKKHWSFWVLIEVWWSKMPVIEKGLLFSSCSYSCNSVYWERAVLNLRQKVKSLSRISSTLEKGGKPGLNPVKILIMLFISVATAPSFLDMCFFASSASFPSLFPSRSYYILYLTYKTYASNLN